MKRIVVVPLRHALLLVSCWLCVSLVGCGWGISSTSFTNPLLTTGADPWVFAYNGTYYYTETTGANLTLWKTQDLSDLRHAETAVVWTPEPGKAWSYDIWAPELHRWGSNWYIYFAADAGYNASHRIYVVENTSADPMQGTWTLKGEVNDATDRWAIDPDLVEVNGAHYLLWSGWQGATDGEQDIFIAQMSDPWTISSPRTMISAPSSAWEEVGGTATGGTVNVNEGPEGLVHDGQVIVSFSGSGCWTDGYALGVLQAPANANLLDPTAWTKYNHAFLQTDPSTGVYAPGHNSFFQSPDGKEDWVMYHANSGAGQGCGGGRTPRMQRFTWNEDGTPNFGPPVSSGELLSKPSS